MTIKLLTNITIMHLHVYHETGLRSRQTFILTLSHCECWYMHIMKKDSGADEHLF